MVKTPKQLLKRKLSNLDKYIQSVSEDQNSKILCVSVRDGKIIISGDKPTKSTRFTIQLYSLISHINLDRHLGPGVLLQKI